MKHLERILLAFLLILTFGITIWQINANPPSLNWDEASLGYNAYSILKTGKDEWGVKFPLIFRAFGDYKLPAYVYADIPFVAFSGLNTVATRLPSVISGVLAILGIYLLTRELVNNTIDTKKRRFSPGIISAFILATLPWHFFISRIALEANLSLTLLIFGIWTLVKGLKHEKFYILAGILLGLSVHTYNTSRVFVPLAILSFILVYRKNLKFSKGLAIGGLVLLSFIALVGIEVINGSGVARYQKLAILTPNVSYQLGQARSQSQLPAIVSRLIYNRPVYLAETLIKNYVSYYSPAFLYQTWGAQAQFAIPGVNLLGLPTTILFILGLVLLLRRLKTNHNLFIFTLLLSSPVAAALTVDPPQALRPNPMMIPITIIATIGFVFILKLFSSYRLSTRLLLFILILSITASFLKYLYTYWIYYPSVYSGSWQYGYEQVFNYLQQNQNNRKIFVTKRYGEPHIFYAFFNSIDPTILQSSDQSIRFSKSDWYWTDKIGNVYFVNDWEIPTTPVNTLRLESGGTIDTRGSILVTSPDHVPVNAHVEKIVDFRDGTPAFVITTLP